MCGIAGFVGEDHEKIQKMIQTERHRGPDGSGFDVINGASIGHVRLAILDPRPEGDQPMWNTDKTVCITYNGEIYNFRELQKEERFDCRTGTDTEVLLHLYEKYGMSFVSRLRGMFAFGIYDTRTRTWHLARDPSGIKPLYVAYPGGKLHFASEMRALLRIFPKKPEIISSSLSLFLSMGYVCGPQTMCAGIESILPGTVLSHPIDGRETRTIIKPSFEPYRFTSKGDFRKEFPNLLKDAVRAHLVSDKPVGLFLSGGMDSSVILHHMAECSGENVRTFTAAFDTGEGSRHNVDAELARKTAEHYCTTHTELLVTGEDYLHAFRDSVRAIDNPVSTHTAYYLLSKRAKEDVDVVLEGSGGDELFGTPRGRIFHIMKILHCLPAPVRALVGRLRNVPADTMTLPPGPELLARLVSIPLEQFQSILKDSWYDHNVALHIIKQYYPEDVIPERAVMDCERDMWMVNHALHVSDVLSMSHGLESRVPLLDPILVRSMHEVSHRWLFNMRGTKTLLRETYKDLLPPHLFALKKAGFNIPLSDWLRTTCRPLVEEMLEGDHIKHYFDINAIRNLYDRHVRRETYALPTLDALINLHYWFEEVYNAV